MAEAGRHDHGMGEETVVEKTWRGMLEGHPGARRGDPAVTAAAYAEPRLRALYPFPSHGALTFHRNTQFPWSNDLPYIVGDAQWCIVYGPLHVGGILGESLTPREAAALVVAHLPDDCGPAFEGPWPRPDRPVD
ncbi:hypothetical protein Shyd_86960 [Streptomyces hydrogenans]|uniref:Uncharacterized protein n=2 Tax=Streptomyces hydrogenans TaxID=1873719 RepID=A0ABQ3PQM3_9ACTN|nr:hypothetical protein GCM10018784_66340 [Streptomyces hydrogenans]GHI27325.1 hypothetical protein Shyd_86960 [Streptomyces hydrogenans]